MHYSLKADVAVSDGVGALNGTVPLPAITRNVALLEAEEKRRINAEAKNALESFIIDTRDKLGSEEGIEQVSTEEVREVLRADFEKMEDWLYEEGRDPLEGWQWKKELEQVAPIFLRLRNGARPRRLAVERRDQLDADAQRNVGGRAPEVTAEERAKSRRDVRQFTAGWARWRAGGAAAARRARLPLGTGHSEARAHREEVRRLIEAQAQAASEGECHRNRRPRQCLDRGTHRAPTALTARARRRRAENPPSTPKLPTEPPTRRSAQGGAVAQVCSCAEFKVGRRDGRRPLGADQRRRSMPSGAESCDGGV